MEQSKKTIEQLKEPWKNWRKPWKNHGQISEHHGKLDKNHGTNSETETSGKNDEQCEWEILAAKTKEGSLDDKKTCQLNSAPDLILYVFITYLYLFFPFPYPLELPAHPVSIFIIPGIQVISCAWGIRTPNIAQTPCKSESKTLQNAA
jgi:hypothetical protein